MICTYGASLFSIFPSWRHSLLAAWPGAQGKLRRARTLNLLCLSHHPSSFVYVTVMQSSVMEASGDQGLQRPAGHADHDERGHPASAARAAIAAADQPRSRRRAGRRPAQRGAAQHAVDPPRHSRKRTRPRRPLTRSADGWHPLGPPNRDPGSADPHAVKVINVKPAGRDTGDRAQAWLRNAMLALAVLAAAAAAVSWDAQYVLVRHVKHNLAMAALEAGIPDVG